MTGMRYIWRMLTTNSITRTQQPTWFLKGQKIWIDVSPKHLRAWQRSVGKEVSNHYSSDKCKYKSKWYAITYLIKKTKNCSYDGNVKGW